MKFPWSRTSQGIKAGLHHYTYNTNGYRSRIHLRIDPDSYGTLMINANRIVHLNPTAANMAFLILEKKPEQVAIKTIKSLYHVSSKNALIDFTQFSADFRELINPDNCPICVVDNLEITAPFSSKPTAPYRMDIALTYRCNNECRHCYNARQRNFPELNTNDWKKIIDRVWDLGIPHIVFTGGEPTLRDDLPELISHAEQNGQITGINTNGRRLGDLGYVESLITAGLDHVQITLESYDPEIHDSMVAKKGAWKQTVQGIRNVLDTPLYSMTNTTMLRDNYQQISKTLRFLGELGVQTIGLNALIYSGKGLGVGTGLHEEELSALLDLSRDITSQHNQKLIWYTPTQYCHFDPTQLELGVKGCSAALYNMCIEPNGSVIPCQSYYVPLGSIINDPWDSIWNHEISISLRERKYIKDECTECILLPECGGGCPLIHQAREKHLEDETRFTIKEVIPILLPNKHS